MVPYFLLQLTSRAKSCERQTLQGKMLIMKTVILFSSKKLANASEYIHKEKCQIELNHLEDSHYKIKDVTEKIA